METRATERKKERGIRRQKERESEDKGDTKDRKTERARGYDGKRHKERKSGGGEECGSQTEKTKVRKAKETEIKQEREKRKGARKK